MEQNHPIKYFGYCRKSQEDDTRQVLSLPGQQKEAEQLAKLYKLNLVKIFFESKSASIPGREVFKEMLDRIEKGEAAGIICWKMDRLARNPIDEGRVKWLLQRGVIKHIRTIDRDYYPEDNALIASVEFGVANQLTRDLSRNTKRGMKQKVDMGQPPHFANTGYKNNVLLHTWEPDPVRAPFILKMFQWYDSGQYSLIQIVAKLRTLKFTTRYNKPITKSGVARILRSPVFYGYFYANGELKKGSYEPIVPKDLWDRVQARLNGKVRCDARKTKREYKYKGLCTCGKCNTSITAEPKKGHIYYHCTKSKTNCHPKYIREEDLEKQLFSIFDNIRLKKVDVKEIQSSLLELYEKDRDFQREATKNLKTQLTKLEEDKAELYKQLLIGRLDNEGRSMALELKRNIESKIAAIRDQIEALADSTYNWLEQSSNLLKLANEATHLFSVANSEQKRQLLDFVSSNRKIVGERLTFTYNKPFETLVKIKSSEKQNDQKVSDRLTWLGRWDSNPRPID